MKLILSVGVAAVLLGAAQEEKKPQPAKDHEWLQKLVGEWDVEVEIAPQEEGQEAVKTKGTASGRMIGDYWVQLENKGEFEGSPFVGVLTLGYDAEQKKYVGTWVDSMSAYLWKYEGSMNPEGTILALDTEGPCPAEGGKVVRFQEKIEFVGDDQIVLTSSRDVEGKQVPAATIRYTKRK